MKIPNPYTCILQALIYSKKQNFYDESIIYLKMSFRFY